MWARASARAAAFGATEHERDVRAHIKRLRSKYSVTEFKLPELGENIDQGDLVRLMISLGASVTEGQTVMELETDKAVVEVPSSVTGTVNEIRVKEGQKVKVGQVIFTVENGTGAKARTPGTTPVEKTAGEVQAGRDQGFIREGVGSTAGCDRQAARTCCSQSSASIGSRSVHFQP